MSRVAPLLVRLIAAAVALGPVAGLAAQTYEILGSVEARSRTAYNKDTPATADPALRGTWSLSADTLFTATHRLQLGTTAELLVDHGLLLTPIRSGEQAPTSFVRTQSPTTGADTVGVQLQHDVYQAYAGVYPVDVLTVRLGRQRLNWGVGWRFSATDALHPRDPDTSVEPGFDGVGVSLLPGANVSLDGALALQDAIVTTEPSDIRLAGYASAYIARMGLFSSIVYQQATMLRPGFGVSLPLAGVLFAGELAFELYDPRAEVLRTQTLASVGAEYSWYGDHVELVLLAEFFYNGLYDALLDAAASDPAVTTDAAGGYSVAGENYAAGSVSLGFRDVWSTDHGVFANLTDQSYIVEHGLGFQGIPGLDLAVDLVWNAGRVDAEFGLIQQGFVLGFSATAHF